MEAAAASFFPTLTNDMPPDQLDIARLVDLGRNAARRFRATQDTSLEDATLARFLERMGHIYERQVPRLRAANACRPFLALPTMALQRILEHCDLLARLAISRTCCTLRAISCDIPHLWTHLSPSHQALSHASNMLRMSDQHPVHLSLEFHYGTPVGPFSDLISVALPRLEYLEITIYAYNHREEPEPYRSGVADIWRRIARALSAPAPMLRALYLTAQRYQMSRQLYLREDTLGGAPARLRACSLQDICLPLSGSCTALSLLTTFDYAHRHRTTDPTDFGTFSAIMPRLETLGLAAAFQTLVPSPWAGLKRAAIILPFNAPAEILRELLHHLPQVELVVTCAHSSTLEDGRDGQPECLGPVHLYAPAALIPIARFGAHGRVSVRHPTFGWPPLLASTRATSLAVHEDIVAQLDPPPPSPLLSELSIVLASPCEDAGTAWYPSLFSETEPLFDFPSLTVLRICYLDPARPCGGGDQHASCRNRSLALTDVADFIARRLRFRAPRLARLVLEGVRNIVDVDLAGALRALHEVVDELEFSAGVAAELLQYMKPRHSRRSRDPTSVFDTTDLPDETWARL